MADVGNNIVRFTYTGAVGERIPREATHIFVWARVVRREAFINHPNIVEVICHENVRLIKEDAFQGCPSLRRVIMPGVKIVEQGVFTNCEALTDVECGKLERAGLISFASCLAVSTFKFGNDLESLEEKSFGGCFSLERITIPLKDGLFATDDVFEQCVQLRQVDLVEGELQETIAALHLEEWRNDMNDVIDSINQILPNASAGRVYFDDDDDHDDDDDDDDDPGEKARVIRRWIRSVLRKITHYQAEHQHVLDEIAPILQLVITQDIVMNNILPFLELPSYIFEVGDDDDDDEEEDIDDDGDEDEDFEDDDFGEDEDDDDGDEDDDEDFETVENDDVDGDVR